MATDTRIIRPVPRRHRPKALPCLLLALAAVALPSFAQSEPEVPAKPDSQRAATAGEDGRRYFVRQDADNNLVVYQILEWTQGRHIQWYEVTLEMLEARTGAWVPVNDAIGEETDDPAEGDAPPAPPEAEFLGDGTYKTARNSLTVSLRAGETGEPQRYRYTVSSYNLLGHRAFTTEPVEFEVKKAYIPEIGGISHDIIYLDTLYDPSIRVTGSNLREETDYYLVSDSEVIRPVEIIRSGNGRRADVVFDPRMFDVGDWLLRAENPGSFVADYPLTIKFMKWYDVSLSAGYAPLAVLYDKNVVDFLGTSFMPLGFDVRGTFIFLKRRAGYWGVSLNGKWNMTTSEFAAHSVSTHLAQSLLSVVYRYPIIRNRLTLEARAGGGLTYILGLQFSYNHVLTSPPMFSIYPAATAGISIAGYAWRGLYVEAGADFMATFTPSMVILSIAPAISVGWTL